MYGSVVMNLAEEYKGLRIFIPNMSDVENKTAGSFNNTEQVRLNREAFISRSSSSNLNPLSFIKGDKGVSI